MSDDLFIQSDLDKIKYKLNDLTDSNSNINSALENLSKRIENGNQSVQSINNNVEQMDKKLDDLSNQLKGYIEKDMKDKELQLAETQLIKVRQELENKYGHYDDVRRHTTGILQAIDTGVIRKETITTSTEELMLATPRYWLAPCLVALSAWICDNKILAEKALDEAIRRDDEKTSLFFALVNRRIGRYDACEAWIKRYFSMQDPYKLKREIVVILDAYTNGLLGNDSSGECFKKIQCWMKEISQQSNFINEQRENWEKAIRLKQGTFNNDSYVYLKKYSSDWNNIETSLNSTTIHDNTLNYFKSTFEGEIFVSPNIKIALDDLLTKLVTDFDKEELPLREQEAYLNAIIESNGDKELASRKCDLSKKAFEEYIDFAQLLTNASILQKDAHSSKAAQRLATALSKPWIVEAYEDVTAEGRLNVPSNINIKIDEWSGMTHDGNNEQQLIDDFKNYSDKKMQEDLSNTKFGIGSYIKLVIGGIIGAVCWHTIVLAIIIWGITLAIFYYDYTSPKKLIIEIPKRYDKYINNGTQIIKALMAEVVDFRRQYDKEDSKFENTKGYIINISANQFIYNNYNNARNIII